MKCAIENGLFSNRFITSTCVINISLLAFFQWTWIFYDLLHRELTLSTHALDWFCFWQQKQKKTAFVFVLNRICVTVKYRSSWEWISKVVQTVAITLWPMWRDIFPKHWMFVDKQMPGNKFPADIHTFKVVYIDSLIICKFFATKRVTYPYKVFRLPQNIND